MAVKIPELGFEDKLGKLQIGGVSVRFPDARASMDY